MISGLSFPVMRIVVTPQLSAIGSSFRMTSSGWLRWQCTSTRPGMTVLPDAFTTVAPCGTCTRARGPAAVMRSPLTRMTESFTGAAPVPSTSRAPTIAVTVPAAPRCALGAAAPARRRAVHRIRALRLIVPPAWSCRRGTYDRGEGRGSRGKEGYSLPLAP